MVLTLACLLASPASYRIEGDGWFRFRREGRAVYANEAELVAREGRLLSASGLPLWPEVPVSGDEFVVSPDGTVTCGGVQTGTIVLAYFTSPPVPGKDGLASSPERPSLASGRPSSRIVVKTPGPFPTEVATSAPTVQVHGAPVPVPAAAPKSLTLRQVAEVGNSAVMLQDIVEEPLPKDLANIVVTTAPPLGGRMALDSARVEAKLRVSGLMPSGWAGLGSRTTVQVVRPANAIPHSRMVGAAVAGLVAQDSGEWVASDNPGDFNAPRGQIELRSERATVTGNSATVTVAVLVDGTRYNSRTVRLQRKPLPNMPAKGSVVPLRVIAGTVVVESRGTVTAVDSVSGEVTLKLDTGAVLTGRVAKDGTVEVRR